MIMNLCLYRGKIWKGASHLSILKLKIHISEDQITFKSRYHANKTMQKRLLLLNLKMQIP